MEPLIYQDCSYLTQFLKEDHQNSTWKSLHVSHNIVCSQICHKHIHIMGWKDQASKEIVACWMFVSLSSCCEKATAGMLRAIPVHFVPLQFNSTQCNVHSPHVATENCIKCGISLPDEPPKWNSSLLDILTVDSFCLILLWLVNSILLPLYHDLYHYSEKKQ